MRVSRKSVGLLIILVVLVGVYGVKKGYWLKSVRGRSNSPLPAGTPSAAPDFVLQDIDGRNVQLADYHGKIVVLNFWATWCQPCRIEIPWFNEIYDQYRNKDVVILGISLDEGGAKDVRPFLRDTPIHYPILLGTEDVAEKYGGIFGIPTTIIIDRKGKIAKKHLGLTDKEEIENSIKELL